MTGPSPLKGKTAIVYGAGGSVGGAVATAFHKAGARLFLAGRGQAALDAVLADLDGEVEASIVDVCKPEAVRTHIDTVIAKTGVLDIVFNAVTYQDVQGTALDELEPDIFAERMMCTVKAQYSVAQAAARHMSARGHGLISTIVGHGQPWPGLGTTAVSWGLVEAMLRQFAADLGPKGVRVAWLRTGGFYESIAGNRDYGSSYTGDAELDEVLASIREASMLKSIPPVAEAGRAAVFLATSSHITAGAINLTAGALSD